MGGKILTDMTELASESHCTLTSEPIQTIYTLGTIDMI